MSGEETVHGGLPCEVPSECDPGPDDHEALPLTPEQLQRYYRAQIVWRDCALVAGLDLSLPPTLEEFLADGGPWWVVAELSDDDWNRMIAGDETGPGQLDLACGEPPVVASFLPGEDALERLYAWHVTVVACLETEAFPFDTHVPTLEDFVETAGTSWTPAREFTAQYGFPEGPEWDQAAARCGNHEHHVWLQASDFEVDRTELEPEYEDNLALTACLEDAGFTAPQPPALEDFVDELGWNWTSSGIWAAVYRDNDRDAVEAFVDRMDTDQLCPGL